MTVSVTKKALNVREKLAELDKPTGIAGEAMLRAETPQEQFNLIGAGRRNLIYNGAMKVAQRGTSFSLTDDSYTLDRWQFAVFGSSGHGTYTVSQDTSDYPVGYRRSMKIDCTTSDTSIATDAAIVLRQRLEGQDLQHLGFATSEAQPLMLSFWIKSNLTGTGVVNLYNVNANKHIGVTYYINSPDTWEYKTVLIQGDTANTFSDDNENRLEVRFLFAAGSTFSSGTQVRTWATRTSANDAVDLTLDIGSSTANYINIVGVQLELGKVATPFEHRSYGEELALCQRYYEVLYADSEAAANVSAFTTTAAYGHMKMQPKRAAPTMLVSAATTFRVRSAGNNLNLTSIGFNDPTAKGNVRVNCTTSGLVVGDAGWLSRTSNGTAYIHADAEL